MLSHQMVACDVSLTQQWRHALTKYNFSVKNVIKFFWKEQYMVFVDQNAH